MKKEILVLSALVTLSALAEPVDLQMPFKPGVETPLAAWEGRSFELVTEKDGTAVKLPKGQGLRFKNPIPGKAGDKVAYEITMKKTAGNRSMVFTLAISYAGREEILRAARLALEKGLRPEELTEEAFRTLLYDPALPDPDLVIRTSGEERLSNFLLFQSAYAELYFSPVLWPDFGPEELKKALTSYAGRVRRFGRTDEQLR